MTFQDQQARFAAIAALREPADRELFDLVARSGQALGRDEVAEALGLPRATAAFRLDKLAELGLLEVEFRRRSGRSGPGAGRPAKLYRIAVQEITASIPERHYDLAAEILSAAVEGSGSHGTPIQQAIESAATERGREIGAGAPSLDAALRSGGYRPEPDGDGLVLSNCPFHRLATRHTATICSLNHALLRGVIAGTGGDPDRAVFDPDPPQCCVRISGPPEHQ